VPTLNERAHLLADQLVANAPSHRVRVLQIGGARILDCGVQTDGSLHAGITMAVASLGGLADVQLFPGDVGGIPCPQVQVTTDQPVAACMASQFAGWQIESGEFFAMGSGPMRAAYGKEALFDQLPGNREQPSVAVGVLESRRIPDAKVVEKLVAALRLPASKITLMVAAATSIAGNLQVVARSIETALHKLHERKFDISQVVSALGTAPLPPVSKSNTTAIGRTNDAILYGGRVILWVRGDDAQIAAIGPQVPSSASIAHGEPFAAIFERYHHDFYKIDPMLFSPAQVVFHNLNTGRTHGFGRLEPEIVMKSFYA
jgi:methenyltetrahydromethanopterin cyclohydrolase